MQVNMVRSIQGMNKVGDAEQWTVMSTLLIELMLLPDVQLYTCLCMTGSCTAIMGTLGNTMEISCIESARSLDKTSWGCAYSACGAGQYQAMSCFQADSTRVQTGMLWLSCTHCYHAERCIASIVTTGLST